MAFHLMHFLIPYKGNQHASSIAFGKINKPKLHLCNKNLWYYKLIGGLNCDNFVQYAPHHQFLSTQIRTLLCAFKLDPPKKLN